MSVCLKSFSDRPLLFCFLHEVLTEMPSTEGMDSLAVGFFLELLDSSTDRRTSICGDGREVLPQVGSDPMELLQDPVVPVAGVVGDDGVTDVDQRPG